jgi:general secretion pathway protein I
MRSMNKKGFTLLEALIAMVILSTAILLLSQAWSSTFVKLNKTQKIFEFAALLERKMAEVELKYRGKAVDSIPEEESGDFGETNTDYTWKMFSKPMEMPDLASTLTSKDGGADEILISLMKQLMEGLGKAVKEVTVTVMYRPKTASKTIEYSVTTYFVDYDKDISFAFPGMGAMGAGGAGGGSSGGGNGGASPTGGSR